MESCVAAQQIDNAGEMNGYLKPTDHLLANPPRFEGGAMWLPAGIVTDKPRLRWSPEQIAGWLKPSQWPGTARSSADAGRSLIHTAPTIRP
jgi:hypothetical protein